MDALFGEVRRDGTARFWWKDDNDTWRVLPIAVDPVGALRGVLEGKRAWMGHEAEAKPEAPNTDENPHVIFFCATEHDGAYALAVSGAALRTERLSSLWGARRAPSGRVQAGTQAPTPREISTCLFEAIQVAFAAELN